MTEWTLAAVPGAWCEHPAGFRQRWLPGAFGELTRLDGELRYRAVREEWVTGTDGLPERTIIEAEIISEGAEHAGS